VSQSASLIAKYQLTLRRQQNGESELDTYRLEAQLAALSSGDQFLPLGQQATSGMGQQPARIAVDALRVSIGKELIRPAQESAMLAEIEQAYAWQRFRRYERAVELYDSILMNSTLSEDLRATVLLHQAYSMSLVSRQQEAADQYRHIFSQFPESAAAETAVRLHDLLERLLSSGVESTDSRLDQAVDSYYRMDYEQSIEDLGLVLAESDSIDQESEVRYFLGRSYEETGQATDAAEQYERVIWIDPESEWAQNAARRLTLMQEFYGDTVVLSEYTLEQLEQQTGADFDQVLSLYSRLLREATTEISEPSETAELPTPELWVRSVPAAAEVWIRGKQIGQTPIVVSGLGSGPLELEVRHGGAREARVVEIPAQGRATIFVEFVPVEQIEPLRLASAPDVGPTAVTTEEPQSRLSRPITEPPAEAEQPAEAEPVQPPVDADPGPKEPSPTAVANRETSEEPIVDPVEANFQRELARAREEARIKGSLVSLQHMLVESERVSDQDVASAHAFSETIDQAQYPVLSSAAALLAEQYEVRKAHEERLDSRIAALRSIELEMEDDYVDLVGTTRARRRISTAGFVVGGIGAAGATASLWLSERATLAMETATDPGELETLRSQSGRYQTATAVSATVGGVGLLTGIITRFFLEDEEPLRMQILSLRDQIQALEAQYGYPEYLSP